MLDLPALSMLLATVSNAAGDDACLHDSGFETPSPAALVAEAAERSAIIRLAATEYWASNGSFASAAALGFADPEPVGIAHAHLRESRVVLAFGPPLEGETLTYLGWEQAGAWRWSCGHAPLPLDATMISPTQARPITSLPDALLPDACRSTPSAATLASEAWSASAPVRLGLLEHWISTGAPAASLAEAGLADPMPVARARMHLEDGVLVATFAPPLAGETFAFAPWLQGGVPRWVCGHAQAPLDATPQSAASAAMHTSLAESDLPEACRSQPSAVFQVDEVLQGMASSRLAVEEYWIAWGALPSTLAATGQPDPRPIGQARLHLHDGALVATFAGDLHDKRLALAPYVRDGHIEWVCGHATPPAGAALLSGSDASAQTTLDDSLLPPGCR